LVIIWLFKICYFFYITKIKKITDLERPDYEQKAIESKGKVNKERAKEVSKDLKEQKKKTKLKLVTLEEIL
jgi:hypothetical protein